MKHEKKCSLMLDSAYICFASIRRPIYLKVGRQYANTLTPSVLCV